MANRVDCENRWSAPRSVKSGAFGTGSWTDTSPRDGCCMATRVAIRELAANTAASNSPLPVFAKRNPTVPVWELVDFVGRHAVLASPLTKQD
jgi:hypothetical protein